MTKPRKKYKPRQTLNPIKMLAGYGSTESGTLIATRFFTFVETLKSGVFSEQAYDDMCIYITALEWCGARDHLADVVQTTKDYKRVMRALLERHEQTGEWKATQDELDALAVMGDALADWMATLPVKQVYFGEQYAMSIDRKARQQAL